MSTLAWLEHSYLNVCWNRFKLNRSFWTLWSQWLLCLLPGRKASRCCAKLLLLLLLLLLLAACGALHFVARDYSSVAN